MIFNINSTRGHTGSLLVYIYIDDDDDDNGITRSRHPGETMKAMLICRMIYHRGGNIIAAVGILSPRWEYYHRGGNYHRVGNIIIAVETFLPRWEYYHRAGNLSTSVGILSPRWKHSHRGGNIITAVEIF